MAKVFNRVKVTTATTGTGTVTLATTAVSPYQTFADAGVANSDVVDYLIEDTIGGNPAWEIGTGTYSTTGPTLTRTLIQSSSGALLNLSGNATVVVTPNASDTITNGGANTLALANGGTGVTSMTTGQILYGGASSVGSTSNLFWDTANARLGVKTNTPSGSLHVANGLSYLNGGLSIQGGTFPAAGAGLELYYDGTNNYINTYNRTSSAWLPLKIFSSFTALATGGSESARVDASGNVLIGTTTAGASKLVVNDSSIQINTSKTPASASDTGTAGQVCWDSSYIYVCTATNTWKRAALSTW